MRVLLLTILMSFNLVYGLEVSKVIKVIQTQIEKHSKTLGISSIERALLKNAKYRNYLGKLVAQRNSTFYPYVKDSLGRTNVERMEQGLAPIGKDGLPVELHHLKQKEDGIIVELTATEHKTNSKVLHKYEQISQIDRAEFLKWKRRYWKERAKEFK